MRDYNLTSLCVSPSPSKSPTSAETSFLELSPAAELKETLIYSDTRFIKNTIFLRRNLERKAQKMGRIKRGQSTLVEWFWNRRKVSTRITSSSLISTVSIQVSSKNTTSVSRRLRCKLLPARTFPPGFPMCRKRWKRESFLQKSRNSSIAEKSQKAHQNRKEPGRARATQHSTTRFESDREFDRRLFGLFCFEILCPAFGCADHSEGKRDFGSDESVC